MRNTDSGGKTSETIAFSSRARGQVVAERLLDHDPAPAARRSASARPCSLSWPTTSGKNFGGIDR